MLKKITSLSPAYRKGWNLTLECGHTRYLMMKPNPTITQAWCDHCTNSTEFLFSAERYKMLREREKESE